MNRSSPRPTTWARRLLGEIIAQRLGVSQVHVAQLIATRARCRRASAPAPCSGIAPGTSISLAQSSGTSPKPIPARRRRRKGGGEVRGRGEEHADHVVVVDAVALQHREQQLLGDVR